jgi:hypothetical protein
MKKQTLSVVGVFLLGGWAVAPGYAEPGAIKANIPFDFVVAGKTLPAGEYRIVAIPHRVDLQDAKGKKIAVVLADEISARSVDADSKIIFHCYREHCFLSEVWSPDYEHGQCVSSRYEEELMKKEIGKCVTVLGEKLEKLPLDGRATSTPGDIKKG